MKFAAVFALLSLVAGCTQWADTEYQGDETENAIAVFEQYHRPIWDKCREQAENVEVDVVSLLTVEHECKCTSCGGCVDRYDAKLGGHVWMMEDAPAGMLAHETMHVILHCMQANTTGGDGNHYDPVWQDARLSEP